MTRFEALCAQRNCIGLCLWQLFASFFFYVFLVVSLYFVTARKFRFRFVSKSSRVAGPLTTVIVSLRKIATKNRTAIVLLHTCGSCDRAFVVYFL